MNKFAREKVRIISGPGQMTLQSPFDLRGGLLADVTRAAVDSRARDVQPAFELSEESKMLPEMCIGMKHDPMQKITIVVLWSARPIRVLKILIALARFAS